MKKSVLTRYRVMAYVTGVLLILLCLGMIAKYLLKMDGADDFTRVVSIAHGWLYVIYLVFAFDLARQGQVAGEEAALGAARGDHPDRRVLRGAPDHPRAAGAVRPGRAGGRQGVVPPPYGPVRRLPIDIYLDVLVNSGYGR
ncbi:hypothetical protein SFUMM280S_08253 [Streptomyces fumanus]